MARFRTAPSVAQKPLLKAFVTSKNTLFALGRHFSSSKIKASSTGLGGVSQKLMRSCVAATWTRPRLLHSCTEPMVTTRLLSARCSPTDYSIVSQTIKQCCSHNSSLCFHHVLSTQKNRYLYYFNTFLPLTLSTGLLRVGILLLENTDH